MEEVESTEEDISISSDDDMDYDTNDDQNREQPRRFHNNKRGEEKVHGHASINMYRDFDNEREEDEEDKPAEGEYLDVEGKWKIVSKVEYQPDKKLTREYVRIILGDRFERMTASQVTARFNWIQYQKTFCNNFCRFLIKNRIKENAIRTGMLVYDFPGLQKMWQNGTEETVLQVGQMLYATTVTGRFAEKGWESNIGDRYMKKMKLKYKEYSDQTCLLYTSPSPRD